jgi:endonuclease G
MKVDFAEEYGSEAGDDSRTVSIAKIDYLADDLSADMAVIRVEKPELALSPITLADREAKSGERVALIGYPAFDSRNDVNDQARYFRDIYEVKRLAPGYVKQSLSGQTTLTHDCTSLGGNSGSPLLELESGTVVGLHFSGIYGVENTAVGVTTIKKLLKGVSTQVAVPKGEIEGLADGSHDAAHFNGRKGFDTSFLDNGRAKTPWPKLSASLEAGIAKPSDGPNEPGELRYTHFGVKYSGPHRLPLMTAVNIDGAKAVRIKRGNDRWFFDGRIDKSMQLGSANFADALIDRGHMVRREDPNWGDEAVARLANDDTFHYVNAAAQHSHLNQGKQLWQGLENFILDNSRTHGFQACVFTGPVVSDELEEIDGATVPMEFWKLVATLNEDGSKLRATAYLLSQGQLIRNLMEDRARTEAMEGVVLGEYRTFQIAVADLAEATGYDFSDYEKADPLAPGTEEGADRMPRFVPLESPDDLIL